MKQKQKPLMLAYIIFLFICLVYHIISSIFKIEFPAWNRVVVAATIASYFFSLGSMDKLIIRLEKINLGNLQDENSLLKRIRVKEEKLLKNSPQKKEFLRELDQELKENSDSIQQSETKRRKHESKAFWLDVIGFLVFFCVLSIDLMYNFFFKSQEVVTLAAFVLVIVVEYLESTMIANYEDICKQSLGITEEMLSILEDVDNG